MKEVAIVSAVRTPIGTFNGKLAGISVTQIGAHVIKEALKRIELDSSLVDEVIMGNVLQAGLGQNPARQATLKAGLPLETPAYTINKVCGSGLKAVALAAQSVMTGDNDVVIAGGMENMSSAPYLLPGVRSGVRMGNSQLVDSMIKDGLWCAFTDVHMGITAENIAAKYGITRDEQDRFAFTSQQRANQAIQAGKFSDEIVPVTIPQKKGEPIIFSQDEHPRPGTTLDALNALKPAFKKDGTVTAGNASGINDGAAAFILMSTEKASSLGIKPLALIRSYASAGVDPSIMGIGPVPATIKALKKAGIRKQDIELAEANEAFAAQALAVMKELELNPDTTNVNGGAIALGHPIGASGARILVTLTYELHKRNAQYGLATLCIGGGQGIAMIIEKV